MIKLSSIPVKGSTQDSIYINKDKIVDMRAVYTGAGYEVRLVLGIGTSYILNLAGTPFATELLALAAMQTFISTL